MPKKRMSWTFRDTAESLDSIWPVYAYLLSLEQKEAKTKFIKAMGAFWQPIAYQDAGAKEVRTVALHCIYKIERHYEYLKKLFSISQTRTEPVSIERRQVESKLTPCWEIRAGANSSSSFLLSYLQKHKGSYNFEAVELARWSLVPYWQPIALSHLEAEPSLISQSAGHCLYLLEKHIHYLRESFGLLNSQPLLPSQGTEVVSHVENGWHDTTEDDEIIGNIFN